MNDFRFGPRIDPDAPEGSLEAKQPWIDHGTHQEDAGRYSSREFMALEWQRLWPRVWLIAGVSSDLPGEGHFTTFDVGPESFIVVRTEDGLRAYYNVCSHRGTRLVSDQRGKKERFVCPFHSWRFSARTGELLAITDEDSFRPEAICHRPGLTEVHCQEHAGIVFIHMGDNPPPLAGAIGPARGLPRGVPDRSDEGDPPRAHGVGRELEDRRGSVL